MNMHTHHTPSLTEYAPLDTEDLREGFLLEELFADGELRLTYTDVDRAIVGAACPGASPLALEAADALRADYFCERRELGVINLGAAGTVEVDGTSYALDPTDVLYIGRGSRAVSFSGAGARFYLVSYPAHADYPTTRIGFEDANHIELGSSEEANRRSLHQYIHEKGVHSCQLVMGWTELQPGGVWNTMPCHTHDRRSEVYCYFGVAEGQAVAHFMGHPQESRVLWVQDEQAVLSPAWSIHCGCGTGRYKFVWAMGGENQRFDDMDGVAVTELR